MSAEQKPRTSGRGAVTCRPRRGIPVTGPDGQTFKSCSSAAHAYGVHPSTITHHLRVYGNLNLLGSAVTPCVWRGVEYPSLKAAAEAAGRKVQTLCAHLARHGNLDRLGIGTKAGNPGNRGNNRPVAIGSLRWPSRRKAAEAFGISERSMGKWLSDKATPAQRRKLIAKASAIEAAMLTRKMAADAAAENARMREVLGRAANHVPTNDARLERVSIAVQLHRRGLTHQQIAAQIGCKPGTVKEYLHPARGIA